MDGWTDGWTGMDGWRDGGLDRWLWMDEYGWMRMRMGMQMTIWCFCGGVFCGGVVVFLWWCGGVFVVVFLWWCSGVFVVVRWCFCGGVVVFLWWCGGVFCGGVAVFLWWCGGVFVVVWWCFCGGVVVFLWWCFCGVFVVVWWCGGVFVVVWWCFCGGAFVCFLSGVDFHRIPEKLCKECWQHWCKKMSGIKVLHTLLISTLTSNHCFFQLSWLLSECLSSTTYPIPGPVFLRKLLSLFSAMVPSESPEGSPVGRVWQQGQCCWSSLF